MQNNQLLPFERNRYYAGKMLTSSDFLAEQNYMNNKRRFLNHVLFGSGVVCGLGVVSLDDLSILVESGVAMDDYGREIVVESSVVKKLSTIEGFDNIKSNQILLCIKFNEENVHSVYAVNQQEFGKEFEYNRIQEGYKLFVMDAEDCPPKMEMEDEFYSKAVIYCDDDYSVILQIPANISTGTNAKLDVIVTKTSDENKKMNLHVDVQLPNFETKDADHEISINFENISLEAGGQLVKEYWVKASQTPNENAEIVIENKSLAVTVNDMEMITNNVSPLKVVISSKDYHELVTRELDKVNLEMKNISVSEDYCVLATIELRRTDQAYLIEKIKDTEKEYISVPANDKKKNEYLACYNSLTTELTSRKEEKRTETAEKSEDEDAKIPEIASGILEIPLGDRVKKGDIRYSGEIMHGLGTGDVYVAIGYENIKGNQTDIDNSRSTYYGDADLFKENKRLENVTTAVKVLNDKGSFVVAAKLNKPIDQLILTYRWTAIKLPKKSDGQDAMKDFKNKSISAVTPTVTLGTKETHYFEINFHNMEACSIGYELTEAGSGEITPDGVYTAPAKEGVYEIRIFCTDMPVICTYAYAIVKKINVEEEE